MGLYELDMGIFITFGRI